MTPIVKGLIAFSTLSAIGVTSAYAGGLFNNSESKIKLTTKSRLEKENFELLDTTKDSDEWKKVLKAYQAAKTKTFTGALNSTMTETNLRAKCKRELELETEESYELARQWCVKEKSISDILGENYTILDNATDKEGEREAWANNVEKLKNSSEKKFKSLKDLMKNDQNNVVTLKEECKKTDPKTIKTTTETFGDEFEKTKEFCSIKKS